MTFLTNKAFLLGVAIISILSLSSHHEREIPEKMSASRQVEETQKTISEQSETSTEERVPQPQSIPVAKAKTQDEQNIISTTKTPATPKITASGPIFYPVIKVVDGDTLTIQMDGKSQTLRLIGLDTPETVDPRKPVQCFGIEASNKAKSELTNQLVRIETDPSQDRLDKYNRLLVYVYFADDTLFNEMMIREGYGHEYTYNTPYKYQKEFKAAENEARTQKKGLWADGACVEQNITPVQNVPAVPVLPTNSVYICTADVYNCSSFKTHAEAQAVYEACGGVTHDVHRLDADKDGGACEGLP